MTAFVFCFVSEIWSRLPLRFIERLLPLAVRVGGGGGNGLPKIIVWTSGKR
jgi:hypothetical protein